MKQTRRIFSFKGRDEVIEQVFNSLKYFKAVTILSSSVTHEAIAEVFNNNKNILCRATDLSHLQMSTATIETYITDSTKIVRGAENIICSSSNVVRQFIEIAEKHHVDIGDHVSNLEAHKEGTHNNCIFCELCAGKKVDNRPKLYESANFLVVPGSGAFIPGYLMILPRPHVMSCAELNDKKRQEMLEVIEDVKWILKNLYGNDVLIWENGSGSSGKGKPSSSIVHAHIHACPSQLNPVESTNSTGITIQQIEIETLPNYQQDSYLLIQDYKNSWHIAANKNVYIPRQYVRQLIAMEHGIETDLWNWREYPFWHNVLETGNTILEYLRANYEQLSSRIQSRVNNFI